MSEPSVFYGEENTVWVDIPAHECVEGEDVSWTNLAEFKTRKEAVAFIREHIDPNCDDEGRICLITESMH